MDTEKIEMLARNYLEVMEIKDPVKDFCSRSGDSCSLSKDQETFLILSQENMKIMKQKLAEANATIAEQKAEIEGLKQEKQPLRNDLVPKNELEKPTGSNDLRVPDETVSVNYQNESTMNKDLLTLIHLPLAAKKGDFEEVKLLLQNGAQVNVKDPLNLSTPLHYAAKNGHYEIVEILLNNEARKDLRNELGMTPLQEAEESLRGYKIAQAISIPRHADMIENLSDVIELLKT